MIDSKKVYSTLETAFADAKQQISDAISRNAGEGWHSAIAQERN
jgi:hypothetical protein